MPTWGQLLKIVPSTVPTVAAHVHMCAAVI